MYITYKWCKRLPSWSKTTFIVRIYWDIWIISICCHNICTSVKENAEQKYAGTDPHKPRSRQWSAFLEERIGFTLKCQSVIPGSLTSLQLSKITLVQTGVVVIVKVQFQHKSTAADVRVACGCAAQLYKNRLPGTAERIHSSPTSSWKIGLLNWKALAVLLHCAYSPIRSRF